MCTFWVNFISKSSESVVVLHMKVIYMRYLMRKNVQILNLLGVFNQFIAKSNLD